MKKQKEKISSNWQEFYQKLDNHYTSEYNRIENQDDNEIASSSLMYSYADVDLESELKERLILVFGEFCDYRFLDTFSSKNPPKFTEMEYDFFKFLLENFDRKMMLKINENSASGCLENKSDLFIHVKKHHHFEKLPDVLRAQLVSYLELLKANPNIAQKYVKPYLEFQGKLTPEFEKMVVDILKTEHSENFTKLTELDIQEIIDDVFKGECERNYDEQVTLRMEKIIHSINYPIDSRISSNIYQIKRFFAENNKSIIAKFEKTELIKFAWKYIHIIKKYPLCKKMKTDLSRNSVREDMLLLKKNGLGGKATLNTNKILIKYIESIRECNTVMSRYKYFSKHLNDEDMIKLDNDISELINDFSEANNGSLRTFAWTSEDLDKELLANGVNTVGDEDIINQIDTYYRENNLF